MHKTDFNLESSIKFDIPEDVPEVPPKKAIGSPELLAEYIPPPPEEFGEPLKNFSQGDIHEIHLSVSKARIVTPFSVNRANIISPIAL